MNRNKMFSSAAAWLLTIALLLPVGVFAAESDASDAEAQEVLIVMDQGTDYSLVFTLSDAQQQAVAAAGADAVEWTLQRTATYANAGTLKPIADETEMYPNEQDKIPLAELTYGAASRTVTPFGVDAESIQTAVDGSTMTLSFSANAAVSRNNESLPHANGGSFLDVCGTFELIGTVGETVVASCKDVIVKPYASFHTMWEVYEDLDALAALGDDDPATATPYVFKGVMGQSTAGYDMPYLIVAKDSAAVANWLALAEQAETAPEQVAAQLAAGTLDYQVPILYSNIHSNEVAAVDGIMEFAAMLVGQESIDYDKLTGLTDAGQAKLAAQRAAQGMHLSELIADKTTYLGAITPSDTSQNSGKVEGFEDYYTSEQVTVNVDKLLDDVFFILVPEENVEGRLYVTRTSSNGFDLNRDNSFQVTNETQNMQQLIAIYNPVTHVELHGQVVAFQVEPCSPPHEPNFEYDLLSEHLMTGGEAFGAAAVANNGDYQSYAIPMRDYLTSDADGNPFWEYPWDDMSTSYTPQFAMLQGCVAYTVELPAYSESARTAATYGMVGLSDFVAANKAGYFADQVAIYERGKNNANSDAAVRPWLVDANNAVGAEGELFRPAYTGEGENGQFFPEAYLIPLDSAHQVNLEAAYGMIEWLTRNDVKVGITNAAVTVNGETYPAGTAVVSMYQAKRGVANGALYDGTLIRNWTELYSEGITAFNFTRGFDQVICTKSAEYEAVAAAVGTTLNYAQTQSFLAANAKSQFSGVTGGDVVISNASEASTSAVNALLKAGKAVGMITDGAYQGDFICSYADWQSVADAYILTGTGVEAGSVAAQCIGKAPVVYISGTAAANTQNTSGYVYTTRVASSYAWNYDRWAMALMNFDTTDDASAADAVIGASAMDDAALAAVQNGTPYVGYTSAAVRSVQNGLLSAVTTGSTDGMDALGTVVYPTQTLVNASYIADGDNVFYGYGTSYFTALPEGAQVLVQRDGTDPMEGFLNGGEESYQAFINGVQGFSYAGKDDAGNDVSVTLFANSLTNKAHQRDEYAFISNAVFASLLTGEPYTASGFTDVPAGAWFAAAVARSHAEGIFRGVSDSVFNPTGELKIAEAVTLAARLHSQYANDGYVFDQTAGEHWYDTYLAYAKANGIFTDGLDMTATATRAQVAKIFASVFPAFPTDGSVKAFDDVSASDAYAAEIEQLHQAGIFVGGGDNLFKGGNSILRQEMATVACRMLDLIQSA